MVVERESGVKPVLSLVTGTLNREASLQRLIRSIERNTPVDWELIVADASDFPVNQIGFPHNVFVIRESPRRGCTAGYNTAFRAASGEWVIWLNDDCEVESGYAETAIRFMERNPEIGLGALYYSDPNHAGYRINQHSGMDYANFGILRRSLGAQVGWFDDDLVMYGNDNSLTYRVLMAGKGVAGIPGTRITHHSENDQHRRENNNHPFRVAQADLMQAKYGPHMAQMREVYERARMVVA